MTPMTPEQARETADAMVSSAATFEASGKPPIHTLCDDEPREVAATLNTYADLMEAVREWVEADEALRDTEGDSLKVLTRIERKQIAGARLRSFVEEEG